MKPPIPTEFEEQVAFVNYCELKKLPYFHVPNSTYTTSWNQKRRNMALGVNKGVPDMFVIVADRLVAVEMKRVKGSSTSPEQRLWLDILNDIDIPAKVCKGAEQAIAFIESFKPSREGEV